MTANYGIFINRPIEEIVSCILGADKSQEQILDWVILFVNI